MYDCAIFLYLGIFACFIVSPLQRFVDIANTCAFLLCEGKLDIIVCPLQRNSFQQLVDQASSLSQYLKCLLGP